MTPGVFPDGDARSLLDSRYAWWRLVVSLALMTIGGCGMYAIVVVLPTVQADFGIARSEASLPYTALLLGFAIGGVMMGRWADRRGVARPLMAGSVFLGIGFIACGLSQGLWQFVIAHGLLVGLLGSATTFGPLVSDVSFWFRRKRGIAVAICASGNYLAGALWPPIVQALTGARGAGGRA